MEIITKFKAIDGKEFKSKNECLLHDKLIEEVNEIMSVLRSRPKHNHYSFDRGTGFIQHKIEIVRKVKLQLLKLSQKYLRHDWIQEAIDNENMSALRNAYLFGEYDIMPLYRAWDRFTCIDNNGREWAQAYDVNHLKKDTPIEIKTI